MFLFDHFFHCFYCIMVQFIKWFLKLLRETASLSIVYINSFHIATICRSIINLQLLYGSRVIQAGDINIWKNISAPWKPMNIACFRTEIVIGIHFLIILQAKLHISYKSIAKADLLFLPAGPFMFNALFKISIIKYICYILKNGADNVSIIYAISHFTSK